MLTKMLTGILGGIVVVVVICLFIILIMSPRNKDPVLMTGHRKNFWQNGERRNGDGRYS